MSMIHNPVEHGSDRNHISEKFPPVLYRAIAGDDRGTSFMTVHNDLGDFIASVRRKFS